MQHARASLLKALLDYCEPPKPLTRQRRPDLSSWTGFPAVAARFIERDPNAFLFGAIFDRMVEATTAWQAPYELSRRLGHLDVHQLAVMRPSELAPFISKYQGRRALHRFTATMANLIVAASQRLVREYDSDAANIWPAGTSAAVVLRRLDAFDGISHKIAHMTVRLLVTYYGVPLTGWEAIDVAEDRHVARVFLRTGLITAHAGKATYRVAEIRETIIAAARKLHPEYPGALDEPAFFVGRNWCNAGRPLCRTCPLARACPQERTRFEIVG